MYHCLDTDIIDISNLDFENDPAAHAKHLAYITKCAILYPEVEAAMVAHDPSQMATLVVRFIHAVLNDMDHYDSQDIHHQNTNRAIIVVGISRRICVCEYEKRNGPMGRAALEAMETDMKNAAAEIFQCKQWL